MLNKLSIRNAKRSARDYMVYILTMTVITALMFSFNAMLFSEDIHKLSTDVPIMGIMIGLATVFIVLIIAWLIHYMMGFMLGKRSREFGTYLLVGMKKKQIADLFFRENMLMGFMAFSVGVLLGILLQQILMSAFYGMMGMDYSLKVDFNISSLLATLIFYYGCYLLALRKTKRKFKKLNIHDLMYFDRQNQQMKEKGEKWKQWFFFGAIAYFLMFNIILFQGNYNGPFMLILVIGFVIFLYLLYYGLSAFVVRYIRNKGNQVYKGDTLFLLRQFSGKVKTMHMTMGTLTVLFAFALVGCSCAMMFGDYMNKQLDRDFPFDIIIHHNDPYHDFSEEMELILAQRDVTDNLSYRIYHQETNEFNSFLYANLSLFGDKYRLPDGSPDLNAIRAIGDTGYVEVKYCRYDTYMRLSDYNILLSMLGMEPVQLEEGEYMVHMSQRVYHELSGGVKEPEVRIDGERYRFAGCRTEGFCQDGHNGADYVIVIPDRGADKMVPYYSQLAVKTREDMPDGLNNKLLTLLHKQKSYEGPHQGHGTKQVMIYLSDVLVRSDDMVFLKYLLSSLSFPLIYIGLVYLCVALTILSVQQLSDSSKYSYRYSVLSKLGMGEKEIGKVIFKQLMLYYICPILTSVLVSGVMILFISEKFIFYTGVNTMVPAYFGSSIGILLGVYLLYFAATYVTFKRNVITE